MTLRTTSSRFLRQQSRSFLPLRTQSLLPLQARDNPPQPRNPIRINQRQLLSSTRPVNMSNDDDYMAFLNKANQDTGAGAAVQQDKVTFKVKDEGSEVPKAIRDVCKDAFYVSEADEPFEEVSLKWEGKNGLPTETEFAKLINHPSPDSAEIKILDPLSWDSRGQYTNILEAVREATKGNDVRVYQVTRDATRLEYWLISHADGKLVGAKALAVES